MPLPMTSNLADGETFTVKVFRDHSEWDRRERWWMMPLPLLNELFVGAFDCDCAAHLDWIEKQHPGCVYVY